MSSEVQISKIKKYDLEERSARFGEEIIEFVKILSKNETNNVLIGQLVRSGTSLGANYMEADGAESKKDFYHKIAICKKEAKETMYWLQLLFKTKAISQEKFDKNWNEARELVLIFSSIARNTT